MIRSASFASIHLYSIIRASENLTANQRENHTCRCGLLLCSGGEARQSGVRDIPIAIGSSRERRSLISTANYPARKSDMRSAMALKLCPHLKLLPGPFRRLIRSLAADPRYFPALYPVNQAAVARRSLSGRHRQFTLSRLHHAAARDIRDTILRETGLIASTGIAPIKFLAKIAADLNKPNGQYVITPQEMTGFLLSLPPAKIPVVGKVATKKLEEMGLRTCADVQKADVAQLLKCFGKFGCVLWERSHRIDERGVVVERERKLVGVERTLVEDSHSSKACLEIIDFLYAELERRLTEVPPDRQREQTQVQRFSAGNAEAYLAGAE